MKARKTAAAFALTTLLAITGLGTYAAFRSFPPSPANGGSYLAWPLSHDGGCATYNGPANPRMGTRIGEVPCSQAKDWLLIEHGSGFNSWFALCAIRDHGKCLGFHGSTITIQSGQDMTDTALQADAVYSGPHHHMYYRTIFEYRGAYLHSRGADAWMDTDFGPGSAHDSWAYIGGAGHPEIKTP